MIPPQALHYVGLALAKAAGLAVGRLTSAALDGEFDREIMRLSRLDEPSLLMEIARRDSADVALDKPADIIRRRWADAGVVPDDLRPEQRRELIQDGQATVDRLLPKARALICPHRDILLKAVDSPEVMIISTVAGYLWGGLPGALVKPIATLLVKRGIWLLCGECR